MSYGGGTALQGAVYQRLVTDPAVADLVGSAVHDAAPADFSGGTYVTLGPESVRDASDVTGRGAWHDFVVSVVSDEAGFQTAKDVAAAVTDALTGQELALARGRVVGLWFLSAQARRVEKAGKRRIDLTFRARIEL
ncbi:uncharacterized protein DUF3168 [Albidovulum inexpectatum]|uniref:Uncharacterized protein DUF3168 n=1 Tax=Albidovulum inexpectatum TaxID=196587 RepID=A0A2S5JIU3_9RHOB|nr:DUF3168 domain-containing protein [Albidovulum inexpectatum]PPB81301.1 uncharacterized protein DUF3168 [Albidovulum inexpectatum]